MAHAEKAHLDSALKAAGGALQHGKGSRAATTRYINKAEGYIAPFAGMTSEADEADVGADSDSDSDSD